MIQADCILFAAPLPEGLERLGSAGCNRDLAWENGSGMGWAVQSKDELPEWDLLPASRKAAGGGRIAALQNGLGGEEPLKVTWPWAGTPSAGRGRALAGGCLPLVLQEMLLHAALRGAAIDAGACLSPALSVIDKGCTAGAQQQFLITHHPFLWLEPFPKMPFPRLSQARQAYPDPPVQQCPQCDTNGPQQNCLKLQGTAELCVTPGRLGSMETPPAATLTPLSLRAEHNLIPLTSNPLELNLLAGSCPTQPLLPQGSALDRLPGQPCCHQSLVHY